MDKLNAEFTLFPESIKCREIPLDPKEDHKTAFKRKELNQNEIDKLSKFFKESVFFEIKKFFGQNIKNLLWKKIFLFILKKTNLKLRNSNLKLLMMKFLKFQFFCEKSFMKEEGKRSLS